MSTMQRARVVEVVVPPRAKPKPVPAPEPKRAEPETAKRETDLAPLCASIEKLAAAIKAQPAPQVTVEAPAAPAPAKPQSYVITVTRDRDKLPEKYRLDPVSTPTTP